jgi:hypothetical protein
VFAENYDDHHEERNPSKQALPKFSGDEMMADRMTYLVTFFNAVSMQNAELYVQSVDLDLL